MTEATLARARAGDEQAFRALTDPYRRELQVHCYRILGSVQDAEDLVQETLLAAWRGLDGFEERASLRTWLYRIATNRCLNALRDRGRRPADVTRRPARPTPEPTRMGEPIWLQPYPDALLDGLPDRADGPDARYEPKEAVGLAFVSGLQRLPPHAAGRAGAARRAGLPRGRGGGRCSTPTEASVNSALQRAREALDAAPRGPPAARCPRSRGAARAARAASPTRSSAATSTRWSRCSPTTRGSDAAGAAGVPGPRGDRGLPAHAARSGPPDGIRLVPTRANGQPAFAYYLPDRTPTSPARAACWC